MSLSENYSEGAGMAVCLLFSFTFIPVLATTDAGSMSKIIEGPSPPWGMAVGQHSPSSSSYSGSCPVACFCSSLSRIMYCSRRGLTVIPEGIDTNSLQLNINGNLFQRTTLQRSNFSALINLEHLYISECGIENIQVGTFTDLINLKWLDLSSNRLQSLAPHVFDGLNLQHLFLNGNRHVRLLSESFSGLQTVGLYLQDCSLVTVSPQVFYPLNKTLRYLWLNGNELMTLDPGLEGLFKSLSHLRLGSNPLHCNCDMLWFKELHDTLPEMFKGAVAPSCLSPSSVSGLTFPELSQTDFQCQSPMFTNIETTFSSENGRLKCMTSGDPAPVLHWILPSGRVMHYEESSQLFETSTKESYESDSASSYSLFSNTAEAVLHIKRGQINDAREPLDDIAVSNIINNRPNDEGKTDAAFIGREVDSVIRSNLFETYICVATNVLRNVSLTINVSWPDKRTPNENIEESFDAFNISTNNFYTSSESNADSRKPSDDQLLMTRVKNNYSLFNDVTDKRLFTPIELIVAVVATHFCTLLLCLTIVLVCCRKRRRYKRTMDDLQSRPFNHPIVEEVDVFSKVWKADARWSYRASSPVQTDATNSNINSHRFYLSDYLITPTLPPQPSCN